MSLKQQIVELVAQRIADAEIARQLNCNKTWVRDIRLDLGLPSPAKRGRPVRKKRGSPAP